MEHARGLKPRRVWTHNSSFLPHFVIDAWKNFIRDAKILLLLVHRWCPVKVRCKCIRKADEVVGEEAFDESSHISK